MCPLDRLGLKLLLAVVEVTSDRVIQTMENHRPRRNPGRQYKSRRPGIRSCDHGERREFEGAADRGGGGRERGEPERAAVVPAQPRPACSRRWVRGEGHDRAPLCETYAAGLLCIEWNRYELSSCVVMAERRMSPLCVQKMEENTTCSVPKRISYPIFKFEKQVRGVIALLILWLQ